MLLYISWSCVDADRALFQNLDGHLAPLSRNGDLRIWHAGLSPVGSVIDQEVSARLSEASLIMPLLSSDYLNSAEYQRLKQNSQAKEMIPVLLRSCSLTGTLFAGLQLLPREGG